MHITITTKTTNSTTVTGTATATDTLPRIQPLKMNPFSNGVLKRHNPHNHNHHHHHHHHVIVPAAPAAAVAGGGVFYKECQKNHAASRGKHVVDGCGEFMPSPTGTETDPASITCEVCGCHRSFHRCESNGVLAGAAPLVVEYSPQHRHYPPAAQFTPQVQAVKASRKRFRTKFSQEQKEKMMEFAKKVGWRIQKSKEELISGFCKEIGVERGVFKVWMHNNKNNCIFKRSGNTNYENGGNQAEIDVNHNNNNNINGMEEDEEHVNGNSHSSSSNNNIHTNASSSSS